MAERSSYIPNYSYPLGHFKSFARRKVEDFNEWMADRENSYMFHFGFFQKMNISFDHGFFLPAQLPHMGLFAQCRVSGDKWRVRANVKLTLYNWNNEEDSIIDNVENCWFSDEFARLAQYDVIAPEALFDENFGFVKDGEVYVEADIQVLEIEGFYQPKVIDYRVEPEQFPFNFKYTDANLYATKAILTAHFTGNWTKVFKEDEFFMGGVTRGGFEQFLDALYGFPVYLFGRHYVKDIVLVAKKFMMPAVARRAEHAIIHFSMGNIQEDHLKWAVEFDLRKVFHAWLRTIDSIDKKQVKNWKIEEMSGEMMKAIVTRVFDLGWKIEDD